MVGGHWRQLWPVHLLRRMGLDAIRPDNIEFTGHGRLHDGFRLRRARQLAWWHREQWSHNYFQRRTDSHFADYLLRAFDAGYIDDLECRKNSSSRAVQH